MLSESDEIIAEADDVAAEVDQAKTQEQDEEEEEEEEVDEAKAKWIGLQRRDNRHIRESNVKRRHKNQVQRERERITSR